MRNRSLARTELRSQWLTTSTVSHMLRISPWKVRWLVREQRLACETTDSGQHLFREIDVLRFNERLAKTQRTLVASTPPGPVPNGQARQLALFGKAQLKLARLRRLESESSTDPLIDRAQLGTNRPGSDNSIFR